jgi:endonuclease YncB( thermonuclease family)
LISHDKGKFGRILGEIFTIGSELSVNKIMCQEGYAVEYYGGSKEGLEEQHQANKQKLVERGIL